MPPRTSWTQVRGDRPLPLLFLSLAQIWGRKPLLVWSVKPEDGSLREVGEPLSKGASSEGFGL